MRTITFTIVTDTLHHTIRPTEVEVNRTDGYSTILVITYAEN